MMTSEQWRAFFAVAASHVPATLQSALLAGTGSSARFTRTSYCAWTTFERLGCDTIYWRAELPAAGDCCDDHLRDGGAWGQPFRYVELAHLIIPAVFVEECYQDADFEQWEHRQDIAGLAALLVQAGLQHQLHPTFLEVKLY